MNINVKRFMEELEQRGLLRRLKVCVNLIPPPDGTPPEVVKKMHDLSFRFGIAQYAEQHEDFGTIMFNLALDYLFDAVLTDEMFEPDADFIPSPEELESKKRAEVAAKATSELFNIF